MRKIGKIYWFIDSKHITLCSQAEFTSHRLVVGSCAAVKHHTEFLGEDSAVNSWSKDTGDIEYETHQPFLSESRDSSTGQPIDTSLTQWRQATTPAFPSVLRLQSRSWQRQLPVCFVQPSNVHPPYHDEPETGAP